MESVAASSRPDPPPLTSRTLRRRPGRPGLWTAFLVLLLPHFWVGIGVAVVAVAELAFPLVAYAQTGHVVDKSISTSRKAGTTFSVNVAYDVDGVENFETLRVDAEGYDRASTGDEMALDVASAFGFSSARDPRETHVPLMVFFAAFWNFCMGLMVRQLSWRPLSRWWLVKRGARAAGVVDNTKRTTGKGAAVVVNYHFNVSGRGTVEGNMSVTHKLFDSAPLPTTITVFHHPRWPRLNVVYELSSWEIQS